jgi:DNA-binding transcriptional regulator YdaS (Cro superfamily)
MNLRAYLDTLPEGGTQKLAKRLGISRVYLLQLAARQDGRQPKADLCVRIEKATKGAVSRLELRDDAAAIWPEEVTKRRKRSDEPFDADSSLEPGGK